MGDIFLAHDGELGRKVAIKVLADRIATDAGIRERFKREALTAARLSGHPHIVTIFDVGEWSDRPFIVMEYLSGGTLAERIRGGSARPSQAFDWLEQAAGALDAAHREGIVHRDVKPANLLFDARGELNVVDFGIARVLDQTTAGVTAPGTILGTSGYLSPEQANGEEATPASDIYGLGVVAFELLTGSRPFERGSATAEAAAHIHEPVPSASEIGDLPEEVDQVFERVLAKQPSERHATAVELVEDLRTAMAAGEQMTRALAAPRQEPTVATRKEPRYAPPRRGWVIPVVVGLLLLGAGGVAAAVLTGGDDPGGVVTRTVPVVSTVRETEPGTTIVQQTTVSETVVTTVREAPEGEPPPPPPATPPPAPSPPAAGGVSVNQAVALTDQATALISRGDYAGALGAMERALPALRGTYRSSFRYEAYANYNYGRSLLGLQRCAEALTYLERSEELQGERSEITQAKAAAESCAED